MQKLKTIESFVTCLPGGVFELRYCVIKNAIIIGYTTMVSYFNTYYYTIAVPKYLCGISIISTYLRDQLITLSEAFLCFKLR